MQLILYLEELVVHTNRGHVPPILVAWASSAGVMNGMRSRWPNERSHDACVALVEFLHGNKGPFLNCVTRD